MKITISIDTGNAAFEDDLNHEVWRCLTELALRIKQAPELAPRSRLPVFDVNGNRVGTLAVGSRS